MSTLGTCTTLINIEGSVYRLKMRDYKEFHTKMDKIPRGSFHLDGWSELLDWVKEHGTHICNVETYNY